MATKKAPISKDDVEEMIDIFKDLVFDNDLYYHKH